MQVASETPQPTGEGAEEAAWGLIVDRTPAPVVGGIPVPTSANVSPHWPLARRLRRAFQPKSSPRSAGSCRGPCPPALERPRHKTRIEVVISLKPFVVPTLFLRHRLVLVLLQGSDSDDDDDDDDDDPDDEGVGEGKTAVGGAKAKAKQEESSSGEDSSDSDDDDEEDEDDKDVSLHTASTR
jgi:hypothetical protein